MELRQLQLQLTDLKFSGRKDEPEDWSPGHWAGYGQGSMGSYPMHVQWIGWIDECDVMWPLRLALTIAWSHGDSVTETLRFNWGKYYELPCLRGNGLVLRCFLWFEWRLFQCSLFDYTGYCVCVCWFFWVMMPPIHPLLKRRIHTVSNLPVRTSRCDHHVLLDSGWVATDEKNMRFFVSKSYVYIYILCFIMYHPACLPAGSRRRGITAVLDQGGHNWPLRGHVERGKLTLLEILGAKKGYPQAIILWNMLFAYSVHTRFLSCG